MEYCVVRNPMLNFENYQTASLRSRAWVPIQKMLLGLRKNAVPKTDFRGTIHNLAGGSASDTVLTETSGNVRGARQGRAPQEVPNFRPLFCLCFHADFFEMR